MMKKGFISLMLLLSLVLGGAGCTGPKTRDQLSGTSWTAVNDGSCWVFHEDQSFHWYQNPEELDDNYYAGTYECHMGADAMEYLTNDLSQFGVTEAEMMEVINRSKVYTLEQFICFSTTNQSFLLNGEEQLSEESVTSYFGFLLQDGTYLDIANMITGSYYGFTKDA